MTLSHTGATPRRINEDNVKTNINVPQDNRFRRDDNVMSSTINALMSCALKPCELKLIEDATTCSIHYRGPTETKDIAVQIEDTTDVICIQKRGTGITRYRSAPGGFEGNINEVIRSKITEDTTRLLVIIMAVRPKSIALGAYIFDLNVKADVEYEPL